MFEGFSLIISSIVFISKTLSSPTSGYSSINFFVTFSSSFGFSVSLLFIIGIIIGIIIIKNSSYEVQKDVWNSG